MTCYTTLYITICRSSVWRFDFTIGRVFFNFKFNFPPQLVFRRQEQLVRVSDPHTGLGLEGVILGRGRFFKILIVPLNCLQAIGASSTLSCNTIYYIAHDDMIFRVGGGQGIPRALGVLADD